MEAPNSTPSPTHTNSLRQWPGVLGVVHPLHHDSKLFGGAAFERCLEEFHMAVNSIRFPTSKLLLPWGITRFDSTAALYVSAALHRGLY